MKNQKNRLYEMMEKVNPDFAMEDDIIREASNNLTRLDAPTRSKINRELSKLPNYHVDIPLELIESILKKYGLLILQEDNTAYGGIFTGRNGQASIAFGNINTANEKDGITFYTPIENSMLIVTWYKMESGRYEIVSYLS